MRQAIAWAYPYDDAAKAAGLIKDVNYIPTTTVMAPGVPGREEVNALEGHAVAQTDAAEGQADPHRLGQPRLRAQLALLHG